MAWTEDDFNNAYYLNAGRGIRLHYNRAVVMRWLESSVWGWINALGILETDSLVILGAGFGWSEEVIKEVWPNFDVICVDTSTWVHSVKDTTEESEIDAAIAIRGLVGQAAIDKKAELFDGGTRSRVTILDETLNNPASRNRVKAALLSANPTWVVTEDLISVLTDAEITQYAPLLDNLAPNIGHFITPLFDDVVQSTNGYNLKTMDEWRTFLNSINLSNHKLVSARTYEVY